MITVEVYLEDSYELHKYPSIPNGSYIDNNTMALLEVSADLKRRASEGLSLDGLAMHAISYDWKPEMIREQGFSIVVSVRATDSL